MSSVSWAAAKKNTLSVPDRDRFPLLLGKESLLWLLWRFPRFLLTSWVCARSPVLFKRVQRKKCNGNFKCSCFFAVVFLFIYLLFHTFFIGSEKNSTCDFEPILILKNNSYLYMTMMIFHSPIALPVCPRLWATWWHEGEPWPSKLPPGPPQPSH